jgi:hypothetical protein
MRVALFSDDPPPLCVTSTSATVLLRPDPEKTAADDMDGAVFTFSDSRAAGGATDRGDTSTGLFVDNGRQR